MRVRSFEDEPPAPRPHGTRSTKRGLEVGVTSIVRPVALIVAFAAFAAASVSGQGAEADQAVTVWLQHAIPYKEAAYAAARLVFLGNAAILIPGVAGIGLILVLFGDLRRGGAALLLAVAMLGLSLLAGLLQHAIVHPGPPESLKLHFRRPTDMPLVSFSSVGNAAAVFAVLIAARLVFEFMRNRRRDAVSLWPVGAVLGFGLAAVMLKHLIADLPPTVLDTMNGYATFGYPSGHVTRTTVLAGTVLHRVPALGAVLVVAMMGSLVYLGDHWTSEVVGGLCLGWAFVEISRSYWRQLIGVRRVRTRETDTRGLPSQRR